jgi:hypothetical protein
LEREKQSLIEEVFIVVLSKPLDGRDNCEVNDELKIAR